MGALSQKLYREETAQEAKVCKFKAIEAKAV